MFAVQSSFKRGVGLALRVGIEIEIEIEPSADRSR
jgi:hypothetical protein